MASLQRAAGLALVVLCLAGRAAANGFGGWQYGRATFYGTDAWSIHKGSCMFGYLDYRRATGWDVTAISDVAGDYKGSCGKCKEVKCKNFNFKDGYGQWLERSNVCWDESASVVVMVTDTCPCHYPNNYQSNKRWCCGDMYHLDLSIWAFEKLSDTKWGVIGTMWRDVPCWHRPQKFAKVPNWKKATPGQQPPSGFRRAMDKRPKVRRPPLAGGAAPPAAAGGCSRARPARPHSVARRCLLGAGGGGVDGSALLRTAVAPAEQQQPRGGADAAHHASTESFLQPVKAGPELRQPKCFVFVRHGASTWNQESRIQGNTDESELTPLGREQAAKARAALDGLYFDSCFSSPHTRARQTAEIVWAPWQAGGAAAPHYLPHLSEVDLGWFQGLRNDDIAEAHPELYRVWREEPERFCLDGRYPVLDAFRQARRAWQDLLAAPGGSHLVITHKSLLRALLCTSLGLPLRQFRAIDLANGAVCMVRVNERGDMMLSALNLTSHLTQPGVRYNLPALHLLKEARAQLERLHPGMRLSIRAPVSSAAGSYNARAKSGAAYQLECLNALVPGLAVAPGAEQLPLCAAGLRELVRANFRAHAGAGSGAPGGGAGDGGAPPLAPLDQGFAALRALPALAYLEACSSSATTEGVTIEATAAHTRTDAGKGGQPEHWFSYRIRVANARHHAVKVLGRGWVVSNAAGELEGFVPLAPDNAVVGQQPVVPPGGCFEYHSCTPLRGGGGAGQMAGHLLVELLDPPGGGGGGGDAGGGSGTSDGDGDGDGDGAPQRIAMPVAPFQLATPAMVAAAAAAAAAARTGAGGSGGGAAAGAGAGSKRGAGRQ
ncbi:2-carboxy-D-arabinitol-1-phosphatase [Scenedesmus sp. PABB004]|nr:2-carboxy-D-arabinitol-1-phosphatase [Scenedesmus sp. PABB004]